MKITILGLIAMMTTTAYAGHTSADELPTSIVLVHGAFVDASGWQSVYNILTDEGYEVLVVQNPTQSLEGDVAVTKAVIAKAKYPVVLVGHSYGGAVITQAGVDEKVKSLVYLAAFSPDVGETVYQLATAPAAPGEVGPPLLPPSDGFIIVDPVKFPSAFAADVDVSLTRFMAASQLPWGLAAVQAPLAAAAWRDKPSTFMVTTQDHMIPPSIQRTMAKRAGGNTVEIDSSHAVMLSHPKDVAAFIVDAAKQAD